MSRTTAMLLALLLAAALPLACVEYYLWLVPRYGEDAAFFVLLTSLFLGGSVVSVYLLDKSER